jgi:hypothetical protein
MNKQELEAKLHNYEERLKDVAKAIEETRKQLAEAEKPKLGHGDWWLTHGGKCIRIFMKEHNHPQRDCVVLKSTLITNIGSSHDDEPILGNIFDMMKDWGKEFEEWEKDMKSIGIKVDDDIIKIYACANAVCSKENRGWCPMDNWEEAYEFWCKLGHALMTLKRKKQGD